MSIDSPANATPLDFHKDPWIVKWVERKGLTFSGWLLIAWIVSCIGFIVFFLASKWDETTPATVLLGLIFFAIVTAVLFWPMPRPFYRENERTYQLGLATEGLHCIIHEAGNKQIVALATDEVGDLVEQIRPASVRRRPAYLTEALIVYDLNGNEKLRFGGNQKVILPQVEHWGKITLAELLGSWWPIPHRRYRILLALPGSKTTMDWPHENIKEYV